MTTILLSVTSVKVSKKNQIAVPAAARKQLGIKPGDRLEVEVSREDEDRTELLRALPSGGEEW